MRKVITLKPSYATTNTVRFDEDGTSEQAGGFLSAPSQKGVLGKPFAQYLDAEQLQAIGWVPTEVGGSYVAEGARGKTYTRTDVSGPSIKLTIETL